MSQLNPNAAEFVPVSPTRSIPSPACRSLLNEEVISQSPKRPERVDIRVPSETEFDSEVKSRPSDFEKNGHDSEHDSSSDDKIEELLNGKSIDEIPEFQPGSTPAKPSSEEFHFGPNAAPFTPKVLDQSEAFSTKAEYGDDTAQLNVSFDSGLTAPLPKEDTDPMSMSFYAEKGGANPFQNSEDLNKVHQVPDNLDDFLGDISDNKENCGFDETISDLPEHDPLGFGNEAIQTTDLDKLSQDDDKEIAPAMNAAKESGDVLRSDLDCFEGHTSEPLLNPPCLVSLAGDEITSSPSPQALAATPEPDSSVSPAADKLDILNTQEVVPQEASVPADFEQHFIAESQPAPEQIDAQPEVCTASDLEAPPCELNVAKEEDEQPPKDQVEFLTSESADLLSGFSHPVPACEYSAEPELCELLAQDNTFQAPHSPVDLLQETKDEITSSVKDDVSSPIDQISHASLIEDPVEIPVSDTLLTDLSCPLPSAQPPSDAFEPSAPVEPSFNGVDNFSNEPNEQICIKTESIKPEFAEPAEIPLDTPSETLLTPTEIIEPPQVSDSLIPEAVPQVQPPQISDSLVSEAVPEVQPVLPVVAEAAAAASAASINAEPKPVANEKDKRKPIGKVEPRKSTSSTPRVGTSTKTLNQSASKTGVTAKTTPKAATSKPATLAAPKSSPRPSTKPKTAAPATSKPTEAATKPSATANLRPVPKPLTRKAPTEAPATKTLTRPATAAAPKTNSTKPTASSRPATSPRSLAAKPAASTAPAKPAAPSKPRVPLSSRTTTTAAATAASKPPASTVTKTTTATSKTASSPKRAPLASRPQTITGAVAKPRVPLTKTVTKSADVEKEKKESANKLTASRTTTTTRTASNTATARSTTTTVKRTETKPLSDRAVASKTSTTTRTTTLSKRPADLKAVSKAKTTKIEKPKENGIAPATVTQEITVVNNIVNQTESETLLVKDNSPIDNKLLIETSNSLVDTTPAD